MPATFPILDRAQLKRIEAVHRGFLYQHLYVAGCILLATGSGASAVIVEADEDIEIVLPDRRLYVQVKTRSEPLTGSGGASEGRFQNDHHPLTRTGCRARSTPPRAPIRRR